MSPEQKRSRFKIDEVPSEENYTTITYTRREKDPVTQLVSEIQVERKIPFSNEEANALIRVHELSQRIIQDPTFRASTLEGAYYTDHKIPWGAQLDDRAATFGKIQKTKRWFKEKAATGIQFPSLLFTIWEELLPFVGEPKNPGRKTRRT